MKNIFTTILLPFFICSICYSQAPEKINYQAVVRDGNGNILPNTSVPVTITIGSCTAYNGNPTTNDYGLINLELNLSNCSPAIDWSSGNLTISSSINSVSGTSDLNSVPYSIYSNQVRNYPTSGDVNSDGYVLSWNENNGEFELTPSSSGTDDQNISGSSLNGTTLTIGIESGNSEDVDLSSLQDGYEANTDDQTASEVIYSSTSSGLNATTVQGAIDEVYTSINSISSLSDSDNDTKIQLEESSDEDKIRFDTDGSERMIINTNGNVGISLNNPKANLDIQDTLRVSRENRQYTEIINSDASGAIIQAVSGEGNKKPLSIDALYETESSTAGANQIRFRTGEISSPSIKMLIDEGGNIGIGNTSPQNRLHLLNGGIAITGGSSVGTGDYGNRLLIDAGGSVAHSLALFKNDNGTVMKISGSKVGIGTDSPNSKLNIFESSNATNVVYPLQIQNSYSTSSGSNEGTGVGIKMELSNSGSTNVWAGIETVVDQNAGGNYNTTESTALTFLTNSESSAPTEKMRIDKVGRLGVGTSNPTSLVHFKGNDNIYGTTIDLNRYDGTALTVKNSVEPVLFNHPLVKIDNSFNGTNSSADALEIIGNTSIDGSFRVQTGANINEFSTDGNLADNSDNAVPTEKAVKTYIETIINSSNLTDEFITKWDGTNSQFTNSIIYENGSVGIGTSSPDAILEVRNQSGPAKIKIRGDGGSTSTRAELLLDRTLDARGAGIRTESSSGSSDQWFIGNPYNGGSASAGFSIGSDPSQPEYIANSHLFINSSGNIGIGTSNPNSLFSISGIGDANRLTFQGLDSDNWWDDRDANITLTSRATNRYGLFFDLFEDGGTTASNVLSIIDDGNVGIGTSSPISNLHVNGSNSLGKLVITPNESIDNADSEIFLGEDNNGNFGMHIKYDGGLNKMFIGGKQNSTIYNSHLTINRDNGFLGVGTTNPSSKLEVYDGNILVNRLSGNENSIGMSNMYIKESDSKSYINFDDFDYLEYDKSGNDFFFKIANDSKLTILENGNVGIGTSIPSTKLHIEGTLTINENIKAADAGGIKLKTDDDVTRINIEDDGDINLSGESRIGYDTQYDSFLSGNSQNETYIREAMWVGNLFSYGTAYNVFRDDYIGFALVWNTNFTLDQDYVYPGLATFDANCTGDWVWLLKSGNGGDNFDDEDLDGPAKVLSTNGSAYSFPEDSHASNDGKWMIEDINHYGHREVLLYKKNSIGCPVYEIDYIVNDELDSQGDDPKCIVKVKAWYPN